MQRAFVKKYRLCRSNKVFLPYFRGGVQRMRVSDFSFDLPDDLIARYPMPERTDSRLMVVSDHSTEHTYFNELTAHLKAGDLLVLNDTRVIPARLFGKKASGGKIEILIERILECGLVQAQVRASKAPTLGSKIILEDGTTVTMRTRNDMWFILQWDSKNHVFDTLKKVGHMPLPPYINRADILSDRERYQTVYGEKLGSVAAPTAGLHFDKTLLKTLKKMGVNIAYITLHVGAGTYQPVRVEKLTDHKMHHEKIQVSQDLVTVVQETRKNGGDVVAVGTTCARSLETASLSGVLESYEGETDIFIYPSFEFKTVDRLITNFHLPESTLLMMVSAFAGTRTIKEIYAEAIKERYRFFSYGDAMLLTLAQS